jgi:tetratricopeptide (TPR) repeat protein
MKAVAGPSVAEQIWFRGVEYAAEGKFEVAKEEFEKALEIDQLYGTAERALKVIKDVIDQRIKTEAAVHYFKGISYAEKEQLNESVSEFNKAIEINPRFASAYRGRGIAYDHKGQLDRAISDFDKAIQINPKDADAYKNRGAAYLDKGQYNQAISDYNKAIELNPKELSLTTTRP